MPHAVACNNFICLLSLLTLLSVVCCLLFLHTLLLWLLLKCKWCKVAICQLPCCQCCRCKCCYRHSLLLILATHRETEMVKHAKCFKRIVNRIRNEWMYECMSAWVYKGEWMNAICWPKMCTDICSTSHSSVFSRVSSLIVVCYIVCQYFAYSLFDFFHNICHYCCAAVVGWPLT